MSLTLRILLIVAAAFVLVFIVRKLRKSQIQVLDSIFWLLLAFGFVLFAVFPQVAYGLSSILGFESPSNFVFLAVIALMVMHDFSTTVKLAELRDRVSSLVQEIALKDEEAN